MDGADGGVLVDQLPAPLVGWHFPRCGICCTHDGAQRNAEVGDVKGKVFAVWDNHGVNLWFLRIVLRGIGAPD